MNPRTTTAYLRVLADFETDPEVLIKTHRLLIRLCGHFQPTLAAWRTVFLIAAGFYLVCNTIYVFLMVAEVQPWAVVKQDIEEEVSGPAGSGKVETFSNDAKGS